MLANASSSLIVNTVVWITSLRDDESGVTRRLLEDLEPELKRFDIDLIEFEPKNKADLLVFLDDLAERARHGLRPIIHFDTHGDKNDGIWIASSDEDLSWPVLIERLRNINVATANNLCVISMACFGFHLVREMHMGTATPFYIIAGSEDEVYVRFIENVVVQFYRYMFEKGDVMGAYDKFLKGTLRIMHSERMLFSILVGYVRSGCMGEGRARRIKMALELVQAEAKANGKHLDLEAATLLVEQRTLPSQRIVDEQVQKFLLGKPANFTIDEIVAAAEKLDDPFEMTGRPLPKTVLTPPTQ